MIFEINGVDYSDCIEEGGITWKRNDVDNKNSGRKTMDAKMHRGRIAIKYEMQVKCMDLEQSRSEKLLAAIEPEFVTVRTVSPRYGDITKRYYSNNVPTTHVRTQEDGTELWSGISFPLIEE